MKYIVLIIDGASGWPLKEHGGRTSLELALTPHLDALTAEGELGLAGTVPPGMEASSACACMSLLGYDPQVYYGGRAGIEARSMGIPVGDDEAVFRANLVAVKDGRMWSYGSGHISTGEAAELIGALNKELGSDAVRFYPGISYRHLLKLKGHPETLEAVCTPPHDIPDEPIAGYLPQGQGGAFLRELMAASEAVLKEHPVNIARRARGAIPATTLWLFWGSGPIPDMPAFKDVYGERAALTSGVDLLRGLGGMMGMDIINIAGVSDGDDNDYSAQAEGALKALDDHDLVVIHVEAPDEAAHSGSVADKISAIERVDSDMVARLRAYAGDKLRLLIMPDHPTPVETRRHIGEPVPFLLWGPGFAANGAAAFSEAEAGKTGLFLEKGYNIMGWLVG
ncbi:MAG: cofactor-independent phosphoglycerate mutase [Dehalococcoidales bacterium]